MREEALSDVVEVAWRAALAGGEVVSSYFGSGLAGASAKSGVNYNLVSQADLDSEKAILEVIRREFPAHGILAEETQQDDVGQQHLWIVDPIDGTNNFLHGVPHFAISVAYYHHGEPVCGLVYNPATDDRYEAVRGQGARRNGEAIRVSRHASLDEVLVGVGFYYDRGAMMEATLAAVRELFRQKIHGIRRFGTASLDLCQVACGMFGAFFEYELSPWDFAAGRLIVTEAGGQITTCDGHPLPLAKTSVLATNGLIHDAMLSKVQSPESRAES